MKRLFITSMTLAFLLSAPAMAQKKDEKKDDKKDISKPPSAISWEIKDKDSDVTYTIIPYEVVSPPGHKKIREMIKDADGGFMFFIVIIDNRKSAEPIEFNAFGGDATFYYYPPKKDPKNKKEPEPEPRKFGFVSLQNFFADSGNTPADKATFKKVQDQFKTALKVPAGSVGWSLCCIRDSFLYDMDRNKVTWAIPGKLPEEMKVKSFNKNLLKRGNVELIGGDVKKK